LRLVNSTVSSNAVEGSSSNGGGIYVAEDGTDTTQVDIFRSTIAFNAAPGAQGDGLQRDGADHIEISGGLFTGNSPASVCGGTGALISLGGNVDVGTSCGLDPSADPTDSEGVNPNVEGLSPNGGPTWTHALPEGSVAVDRTDECLDPDGLAPVTHDQRGARRDGSCDAGAYEYAECDGQRANVIGTEGPDRLLGANGDDSILAYDGDDEIDGGAGADRICAGGDADRVTGSAGVDRLFGGDGDDVLLSRDGVAETVDCGPGADIAERDAADSEIACDQVFDAPPVLSFTGEPSIPEGDSGTTQATFGISLDRVPNERVQAEVVTSDSTALAGDDYAPAGDTLVWEPGAPASRQFGVGVIGDAAIEPDETFAAQLSSADGATIADSEGIGTILDDDTPAPVITPPGQPRPPIVRAKKKCKKPKKKTKAAKKKFKKCKKRLRRG
jgi:hypothetical protein